MEKFLEGLNDPQKEAVLINDGPVLVSAPPGSGKSKIIVNRVAQLIESGADPNRIMVATFTRKAASELRERVTNMVGSEAKQITCGTFHSICLGMLKELAEQDYRLISESEARNVVAGLLAKEGISLKARDIMLDISYLKAWMITPPEAMFRSKNDLERRLAKIYASYEAHLKENGLVDFDNILLESYRMFNRNKAHVKGMYDHLLIDEYQDVNYMEAQILNFLADKSKSIFAVGDPWQAIYGFLGANLNEFIDFPRRYAECKPVSLDLNYRSTKSIVAVSNALIKNRANMRSAIETQGEKAILVTSFSPEREATDIAKLVRNLPGKTAILVRASWQLPPLIEALKLWKIPFEEISESSRSLEENKLKEANLYLLTIHASKGLEFDNVVIVGLEEGILPYKDVDDTDEEKRLFYVAITRAKKKVFISVCLTRKNKPVKLSRFLSGLPKDLIERS